VAGTLRKYQNCLIQAEELLLFTSSLCEIDHRLRDESLDWCAQYYDLISVSRLKNTMESFRQLVEKPFSIYAASLNQLAPKAKWPLYLLELPLKIHVRQKSRLDLSKSPAL